MFTLLISLMACGEKEVATEVATANQTTTENTVTSKVPTAVYPLTEEVKQVAPDAGTTALSGADVTTTGGDTTTDTTETTGETK